MGTAHTWMVVEPLTGWRKAHVRATQTARALAHEIKELLDVNDPTADKVVRVGDNLNTPAPASLYNAFPPEEAHRLWDRWEIQDTPQHGS